MSYDGDYKALKEPKVCVFRRTPSLDEARDRIFTARCQGRTRMVSKRTRQDGDKTSQIDLLEQYLRRKHR